VGQKLSDLTTKKMIIIILAMLFSVPLFDDSTYITSPNSYEVGLHIISAFVIGTNPFETAFMSYIEQEVLSTTPLIYVNSLNVTWQSDIVDVSSEVNCIRQES